MPIIFVDMSLPKPSGEFEWVQESWGAALRCRPLAAVARHCFSTRELELEGVRADGMTRWQDLANTLGVELDSLVRMRQVHCADVFEAKGRRPLPTRSYDDWPEADIAVTDDPSVAVSVTSGRLRADPARRSPNRCGCGHSRRLEGHRRRRGHRRRSRPDVAIWHESGRRHRGRRSEHRSVLLRGRSRSRQPFFIARAGAATGSRGMRSRISISGAPRATSSRAREFRRSRFTCARCAPSTIPRCSIHTGAMAKNAGRLVAAIRSGPGRTP